MLSWCGWSESKSGRSGGESFDESVSKSQSAKVHRSVRVKRVAVVVVVVARRAACDEYSRRCRSSANMDELGEDSFLWGQDPGQDRHSVQSGGRIQNFREMF